MQVYLDEKEGLQQVSEHRNPEPPFQRRSVCSQDLFLLQTEFQVFGRRIIRFGAYARQDKDSRGPTKFTSARLH